MQIAFSTWLNQSKSEDITICNEDNYHTTENNVKEACSQVLVYDSHIAQICH